METLTYAYDNFDLIAERAMERLNGEVDVHGKLIDEVAATFLKEQGLLLTGLPLRLDISRSRSEECMNRRGGTTASDCAKQRQTLAERTRLEIGVDAPTRC